MEIFKHNKNYNNSDKVQLWHSVFNKTSDNVLDTFQYYKHISVKTTVLNVVRRLVIKSMPRPYIEKSLFYLTFIHKNNQIPTIFSLQIFFYFHNFSI